MKRFALFIILFFVLVSVAIMFIGCVHTCTYSGGRWKKERTHLMDSIKRLYLTDSLDTDNLTLDSVK